MPSTRANNDGHLAHGLPDDYSSDDFDPDYCESEEGDDELPRTMERDRAQWVVDNTEDLEWLYRNYLELGRSMFGNAFFQQGNITAFAHFIYRHTTPLALAGD
jgi:hypothetical protein|tara:strand:+ start:9008 stop:9316 length:309 start_codon:yes stop_codon:yes gene_type:complete